MLTSRRITQGAALKYAAEYGLEGVMAAVKRYDELLAGGYQAKSASGLLVDILRHPLKYQTLEAAPVSRQPAVPTPLLRSPEPSVEADRTLQTATFMLKKVTLPDTLKDNAAELYLRGHVSAAELAALTYDPEPARTVLLWNARENGAGDS